MKTIKKLILIIPIIITYIGVGFWWVAFPYSGTETPIGISPINIDIPSIITGNLEDNENVLNKLLWLFMPDNSIYDEGNWPSVLFYLKTIVNLLLWLVSLVAFIITIYAFYMMFFKKDEAGWTNAKQIIKWVFIALLIIWLSWIAVSFLFRFEKENTQNLSYDNTKIQSNIEQNFI